MSEEMNQFQENQPHENHVSWEAQLQQRANELLAQRIGPLKTEIERLRSSFNEISARLLEQARPETTEEEGSWLLDHVRQWFNDSTSRAEEDFKSRLEHARNEAEAIVRKEAEKEYESRLEKARIDWHIAAQQTQQANETEFQRRLETACAEAAAVARRESEVQLEDLREQLEASRKALTLAVSSAQNTSFDTLRSAIEEIDEQRSQSDTLSALVRRAAHFAPRVVFFVLKGGDAVGWKANGFENGLNDETAKLLSVRSQTPSLLAEALANFHTSVSTSSSPGENSAVLGLYGSPAPERAVAIPLVVRGKAAAVLYADSGTQSENSINTAAIETLMRAASMGIELLPSRRGVEPSRPTSTKPTSATATATGAAPATEKPSGKTVEPFVEPAYPEPARKVEDWQRPFEQQISTPEPNFARTATAIDERLEFAEAQSYEPAQVEAEPYIASTTEEMPAVEVESPIHPPFSVVPPPPPTPSFVGDNHPAFTISSPTVSDYAQTEFRPEEQYTEAPSTPAFNQPYDPSFNQAAFTPTPEPPRAPQPQMSVPTPASETEQRAHNDARRFARLLVSEIKLYNAAKVNDGRRNFDLYERLKDEIDRSRKVYDKRVSPAVAARFDYFYDELVQTLAEGDPAKLGNNCPGPVVLAS